MSAMILVGEIGPGVTLLINDDGRYVLRGPDGSVEVDARVLTAEFERTRPVAVLVSMSETPISGISGRVERSLEKFGCSVVRDA